MATAKQQQFCRMVFDAAKKLNEISPYFVAAQACLESSWGARTIGKYNCFGITVGSNWNGKKVLSATTEIFTRKDVTFKWPERVTKVTPIGNGRYRYSCLRYFKDFESMEQCLEEHLRLFKKSGYADAWPYRKDAREFAKRIADNQGCKYATAPTYAKTMCDMIASVERIIGK